ncbi:MAG: Gfo/Idh/MocA family oxidoreductase [Bryobacteraceae bacterium]|nr:Gfo/Idh/MocA family oxidoreductase [Bryobacteraceae bacterium]
MAGGIAGSIAVPGSVLGANERIRLGVIGFGARGTELAREAMACPNTALAGIADAYAERLDQGKSLAPDAEMHADYRRLLDSKDIDAVIVATPQHLHAEHFVAALQAGKHVYQEKTLAFTVEQAKKMRAAHAQAGKLAVQVGHQWCSSGKVKDAINFLSAGKVGRITAIRAHMFRNTPRGKPQWARPVYPGMTEEQIAWDAFLGEAPRTPFDANRFVNWRLFWDYSGGSVHENMSQQLAFWYKVLDLGVPRAVTMVGGVYLWKDGRETPDTMSVSMEHDEEILFTWDSGFGNNQPGTGEQVLGSDGSIVHSQQIRYLPQKVNRPDGVEILGSAQTRPRAMMQNFLDCIRSGSEPDCPFEVGYRVSIACRMAVESYRSGRTVLWDPEREEIV